jgi:hypothetical protein
MRCFKCKRTISRSEVHKKGKNKFGPWWICKECVQAGRIERAMDEEARVRALIDSDGPTASDKTIRRRGF